MPNDSKIKDAADVVKGIVEAVPVYQDLVQPAAKEVGTALQTVAKTIHIVLSPLKGLVWGYEKIMAYNATYGDIAEKAEVTHDELFHVYLENLFRLNLLDLTFSPDSEYEQEQKDLYQPLKDRLRTDEVLIKMRYGAAVHADYKYEFIGFTSLGKLFADACIHSKDAKEKAASSDQRGASTESDSKSE